MVGGLRTREPAVIEKQTKSTNNVKGGLFKGIINHKDTDGKEHAFILTEQTNDKNKSVISGMNIKYYDILYIIPIERGTHVL